VTALIVLGACVGITVLFLLCAAGAYGIMTYFDDLIPIAVGLTFGWVTFMLFGIPLIVLNLFGMFP
jgi:hypothetical protein